MRLKPPYTFLNDAWYVPGVGFCWWNGAHLNTCVANSEHGDLFSGLPNGTGYFSGRFLGAGRDGREWIFFFDIGTQSNPRLLIFHINNWELKILQKFIWLVYGRKYIFTYEPNDIRIDYGDDNELYSCSSTKIGELGFKQIYPQLVYRIYWLWSEQSLDGLLYGNFLTHTAVRTYSNTLIKPGSEYSTLTGYGYPKSFGMYYPGDIDQSGANKLFVFGKWAIPKTCCVFRPEFFDNLSGMISDTNLNYRVCSEHRQVGSVRMF